MQTLEASKADLRGLVSAGKLLDRLADAWDLGDIKLVSVTLVNGGDGDSWVILEGPGLPEVDEGKEPPKVVWTIHVAMQADGSKTHRHEFTPFK